MKDFKPGDRVQRSSDENWLWEKRCKEQSISPWVIYVVKEQKGASLKLHGVEGKWDAHKFLAIPPREIREEDFL